MFFRLKPSLLMSQISRVLVALVLLCPGILLAQPQTKVERMPPEQGIVENVFFMPYITGSYNMHSGKAFLASASGAGFGLGLAFDLTRDGQKSGLYFDIAWQDMRAASDEGICMNDEFEELLTTERAEHYYKYVLFEPFLKLQGERANGYFLIGGSLGYNVQALLVKQGDKRVEHTNWSNQEEFHNPLRLDIRAGLGLILAKIGTQKLILEARVGYPVTNAISDYRSFCDDTGLAGNWKIITLQANLGLRF
jgi:hypothetical protein